MNELIKLLNLAQGERTLNQYALNSGISNSMLSLIKSGQRKPSADILLKLSKNARNNVTYKDLMKAAGYWNDSFEKEIDHNVTGVQLDRTVVKIPVYGEIPAGMPIEMIDDSFIEDEEEIPASWLKGGSKYFCLRVRGESMMPKFEDGDTLILKQQETCESGSYCAVSINHTECTFKKVIIKDNGITLMPLNPEFEPIFFTNQEIEELPITILGVVKEVRRNL